MLRKYREEKQDGFNQQLFKVKYILKKVKYIWPNIVFFYYLRPWFSIPKYREGNSIGYIGFKKGS